MLSLNGRAIVLLSRGNPQSKCEFHYRRVRQQLVRWPNRNRTEDRHGCSASALALTARARSLSCMRPLRLIRLPRYHRYMKIIVFAIYSRKLDILLTAAGRWIAQWWQEYNLLSSFVRPEFNPDRLLLTIEIEMDPRVALPSDNAHPNTFIRMIDWTVFISHDVRLNICCKVKPINYFSSQPYST